MKQALEQLQTYTWGDDPQSLRPIEDAITSSYGNDEARREIEAALIAVLHSDASRAAKDYVCRQLKIIATDASVPALASLLGDADQSHMARFALQSIPRDAATDALIQALDDPALPAALQLGVIGSLGARGDDAAVAPLSKLLSSEHEQIATAAANALGAIRSAAAAKALAGSPPRAAVMNALLSCAEAMLDRGDKAGAKAIYQKLLGNDKKQIKLAATRGILACAQ
jgi:HEAT repeat protein